MTFDNGAWALNGPLTGAALARRAMYAESRQEGIVQRDDLKVTELSTPGVGVQIADGVGLVLNGYQTDPNEMYVVSNAGTHTIPSGEMPASNPAAKSYLVAIVIGDPDFSQVGHPWMTSEDPPVGQETTFQYVRPTIIEVAAGTTSAAGLGYPALALARLDVPANTTTITNSMIIDLRKLSSVRSDRQIFVSPGGTWNNTSPVHIPLSPFANWGSYAPQVFVPTWAKRAIIVGNINGVGLVDTSMNIVGDVRTKIGSLTGPGATFDIPTGGGAVRLNLQTGGEYDVSALAGTTVAVRVEGQETFPASPTLAQRLRLQNGSQMIFDVQFLEE